MRFLIPILFLALPLSAGDLNPCALATKEITSRLATSTNHRLEGFQANLEIVELPMKSKGRAIYVKVNGVFVTGGGEKEDLFLFATERDATSELFNRSLKELHLEKTNLKELHEKKIASIGEGFGPLVPGMTREGLSIVGVDLWYHHPRVLEGGEGVLKQMQLFNQLYGDNLVAGTCMALPLENESQDLVISRRLLSNLTYKENLLAVDEMVRVTKRGGEIRIFGLDLLPDELRMHLDKKYRGSVEIEQEVGSKFDGFVKIRKK